MSIGDIKAKLMKAQEAENIERAIDLAQRAIKHDAVISRVVAEDAAESERSVVLVFTVEESASIMKAAIAALEPRLEALKAELGA